jgi:o-succinylbenzoate---CoA ligase
MSERSCPIAHHAQNNPEYPALIDAEKVWTYAECDARINGCCAYLKTQGVRAESRVAFIAETKAPTIFLFFALFRLKAIACPLSFREPRRDSLLEALKATHYFEPSTLPFICGYHHFSSLSEEALATFLFTSGSSGAPKIACHTLSNHLYNALGCICFFSLNSSSRWLLSLPLFHVGGLAILFRLFLSGGAVVLPKLPLSQTLSTYQITHVSLVPTLLYRLLQENLREKTFDSVRVILLGGAPFSPQLCKRASAHNLPLIHSYGMTEMASLITATQTATVEHVGKPLPFRELTLSSNGEILVKGATLFHSYLGAPKMDGWFPTGDLGAWTAEGNLRFLGRKDRLFISGGENIYPEEIERALCTIEGILSATVVPCEDLEFGQRPIAFIHDTTQKHTLESIREALKPLLPSFKHPMRLLPYPEKEDPMPFNK